MRLVAWLLILLGLGGIVAGIGSVVIHSIAGKMATTILIDLFLLTPQPPLW